MSSFWNILDVPLAKAPISVTTFVSYVVPPVACYFIFAVLAISPQTRVIRVALWPIVALLALRAVVFVDLSLGKPERKFFNTDLMLSMLSIVINTFVWALAKKPLVRHLRPANSSPSLLMDALDLTTNVRGHGWDWSRGLYVPRDTRPRNRVAFAFYALLSGIVHTFICGGIYHAIFAFTSAAESDPNAYTIFDPSLPVHVRYLRSSIIATLGAFGIYTILQLCYDLATVLGILVGQDPAQWPPAFESPWFSTSLTEFWGRRWHQWMRQMFVLGGYPLAVVFGRAGGVVGAFLASAVFHHATMLTFSSRSEFWPMLVGFGMMGPALLAERAFYKRTGRKVCGVAGWVWTMAVLVLGGNFMVEGFARAGMFLSSSPVDKLSPVRELVRAWVMDFDAWLHTL